MKYERLTKRHDKKIEYKIIDECGNEIGKHSITGDWYKIYYRLAELEDKIEAGTLVELPKPFIDEMGVIDDNGDIHIRYDVYCSKIKTYFNDSFYDKEAAEARLKELISKDGNQ